MIILDIWSRQPGKFFCISTKSGSLKWKDHFFAPEDFGTVRQFLRDYDDQDIYFCPHGFNRRSRTKEEAVLPNLLWADLDNADPRDMKIKPTYAFESSPGRFVGLWELKDVMSEELNRRLTYHLEADPGGWDLTQVLRFPGTKNYKYRSQPKVRVLWDDGPKWSTKKLNQYLPPEEPVIENKSIPSSQVFELYQDKLPRWVRRELLAVKAVGRADRSEMLWKLENACIEAGMTIEEAFSVIKRSVWNKFAGRRNEDKQLRDELSKVIENHFREKPKGADKFKDPRTDEEIQEGPQKKGMFNFIPLKEIQEEDIDWIWYPYLAKKTLSILEGDPGLGKSYMAMMVSAAIATGDRLPCVRKGKGKAQGGVVYFDIENNAASVTKVRLKYNGYDDLGNYYPIEQAFSIEDEEAWEEIYEYLEEIQPLLIVFDTLNTYIGRADTHKASEATQAMNIFKQLTIDFNCAVLVLRHLTKGSGAAMYRGQGSVAFAGSARVVMCVGVDPNDSDTRVMCVVKGNLAPNPGGLAFRIEARKKDRSEFIWDGFNELTAQEVMDASTAARTRGQEGSGIQDAMEFLEATITGAAVELGKLYRMGEKRSITPKLLDRAASKMNVKIKTKGKGSSKTQTWEIKKPSE